MTISTGVPQRIEPFQACAPVDQLKDRLRRRVRVIVLVPELHVDRVLREDHAQGLRIELDAEIIGHLIVVGIVGVHDV